MSTKNQLIYDIAIVGVGAAGAGVAFSLLKCQPKLNIAIIEAAGQHYYQPAWTLVGAGEFNILDTARPMCDCLPKSAIWIKAKVTIFEPDKNCVKIDNGADIYYKQLIVEPGLKLNCEAITGLTETLGKNGVSYNYNFDLATYT